MRPLAIVGGRIILWHSGCVVCFCADALTHEALPHRISRNIFDAFCKKRYGNILRIENNA